jgi:hypothetical protein
MVMTPWNTSTTSTTTTRSTSMKQRLDFEGGGRRRFPSERTERLVILYLQRPYLRVRLRDVNSWEKYVKDIEGKIYTYTLVT